MNYKTQTQVTSLDRFTAPNELTPASTNFYSRKFSRQQLNDPVLYLQRSDQRFFDAKGNIIRFDCSLDDFDALPIERRLHWIQQFMKQVPHANHWFNNIAGIIEGFVKYKLAEHGSWLSIVDAAILQGIQDGYARSAGLVAGYSVNPGARFWCQFFDALGKPTHDLERINLWGCAETAATNFGVEMAALRGLSPNKYEWVFWQTGNIYRWAIASFDVDLRSSEVPFIDPRILWRGRSPVYWFSTTFIWSNQGTVRWA